MNIWREEIASLNYSTTGVKTSDGEELSWLWNENFRFIRGKMEMNLT